MCICKVSYNTCNIFYEYKRLLINQTRIAAKKEQTEHILLIPFDTAIKITYRPKPTQNW